MSSTTEPDSPSVAGEEFAPSQQIVRLQGGGIRFLDAHEISQRDFNVVTRAFQNNNTQHWRVTNVGGNIHTSRSAAAGFSTHTRSRASISAWSRGRSRTTTPSAGAS